MVSAILDLIVQTRKLLLLDKDGTLVRTRSGNPFVNRPWDQEWILFAKDSILRYQKQGWRIAIVSNQGGVAAGYKSVESAVFEMQFLLEMLPDRPDLREINAFFCPDDGRTCYRVWGECNEEHRIIYTDRHSDVINLGIEGQFRKPACGMLKLACEIEGVADYANVLMVGDRPEDKDAAAAAGMRFLDAEVWRCGR